MKRKWILVSVSLATAHPWRPLLSLLVSQITITGVNIHTIIESFVSKLYHFVFAHIFRLLPIVTRDLQHLEASRPNRCVCSHFYINRIFIYFTVHCALIVVVLKCTLSSIVCRNTFMTHWTGWRLHNSHGPWEPNVHRTRDTGISRWELRFSLRMQAPILWWGR